MISHSPLLHIASIPCERHRRAPVHSRGGVAVVVLIVLLVLASVAALWIYSQKPRSSGPRPDGTQEAIDLLARETVVACFTQFTSQDKAGSLDQAEAALAPLLARAEPHSDDLVMAAIVARARQSGAARDTQVRAFLARVLERNGKDPRAHYILARMDMMEGDFESATAHLKQALAAAPEDVPTQLGLAQLIEESSPKEAESLYRKVIARGVDSAASWYVTAVFRIAGLMRDLGRDSEFERYLAEFQALQDRGLAPPTDGDHERGNLGNLSPPPRRASDLSVSVEPMELAAQETLLPELAGFERLLPCDLDGDGRMDLIGFGPRGAVAAQQTAAGSWRATTLDTGAVDWLIAVDMTPIVDVSAENSRSGLDVIAARRGEVLWWRVTLDEAGIASWTADENPLFVLPSAPLDGVAFDLDHEGDLDLALVGRFGLRILRNDGARSIGGSFTEITQASGAPQARPFDWIVSEDFDTDQDVDLLCGGPRDVCMLSNLRGGQFADVSDDRMKNFSVTPIRPLCADIDLDGRPDLWGAGPYSLVYFNQASMMFRPDQGRALARGANSRLGPGLPGDPWAGSRPRELLSTDFDGDGLLDAAWLNPDAPAEDVLAVQLAVGRVGQAGADWVLSKTKTGHRPAIADIDGDSVPEVLLSTDQGVLVSRSARTAGPNLRLSLRGAKDNRRGVGAVVERRAGGEYRRVYWRGEPTELGLGKATSVDWLRITWPNGVTQYELGLAPGERTITQIEGLVGSCPFLYTWDGSRYTFVTDVLGITPLGLPMAPGVLVPPDHDEYVLVRGEQLAARNGKFELQITEELREVTYLDRVRLDVVDHPADTEIFPNEMFCFPPFPLPHLHTLRAPLSPTRATGSDGGDWTKALGAIDDEYAAPFKLATSQMLGLATPHFVEVEFDGAKLANAETLRLFLTGWFYWTDASVNMASARDPAYEFIPPIFQVPDGQGGWKDCGPPVGFPAGKTKTMVVDVTHMLVREDPRLRVFTSLRLYWDAIRLGIDPDDAPMAVTPLECVSADLWRRGFSEVIEDARPEQPTRFDWKRLAAQPRWNPHPGIYTKYGPVDPLLTSIDDQFVILGSGDALKLQFDATELPDLLPGYRRDYILFLDGWAKDRDPNSISALHVEPLPFHGMSGYPYGKDERFPMNPERAAWMRNYQTRMSVPWH